MSIRDFLPGIGDKIFSRGIGVQKFIGAKCAKNFNYQIAWSVMCPNFFYLSMYEG